MTAPHRRQFLKTIAASAGLAPSFVLLSTAEGEGKQSTGTGFPDRVTGKVLRTSGTIVENESALIEPSRKIPIAGKRDVIVCGGGPAGIAAALASARNGAETQLIELAGCLGGVWTAGMLTKILDTSGKSGIMREILDAFAKQGSQVARDTDGTVYDPELAKLVLEEMCVEAGIKIRLHTSVVGAVRNDRNQLVAVITESKSGREAWLADRFIDCTGDGDLAAQAGCGFDVGVGENCTCQPMSLMALLTGLDTDQVADFIRENGSVAKKRFLELMRNSGIDPSYRAPTLRHLHSGIFSLMTNHEYGVSAFDADAVTEATINARREVHEIVAGLRKLGGAWKDIAVVATAEQIGIREGRRIHGRYTITGDNLTEGLRHEQAVCRAKFPFDVHSLELSGNPEIVNQYRKQGVKAYDIPYPALVAKDVDGLLMAGRCISGDFLAHSSYRVTGNAVPMGEAAGIAAARSRKQNVLPHEFEWNSKILG